MRTPLLSNKNSNGNPGPTAIVPYRGNGNEDSSENYDGYCKDILQFSCAIYFVEEGEGAMEIDIMRLGSFQGNCSCEWYTEDSSAVAGEHYVAASGVIEFATGEMLKTIKVDLIDDDYWNTSTEFLVNLRNPSNCDLGVYLKLCRVKVIDNDYFPSNKFEKQIKEDALEEVKGTSLIWAFIKFNLGIKGNIRRTLFHLVMSQFSNMYFLLTIYIQVYLVDVVLNTHGDEDRLLIPNDRLHTAMICGILYILPLPLEHVGKGIVVRMNLCGESIAFLQRCLMRKYLNYNSDSYSKVKPSALSMGMIQEITEVVDSGYMRALECVQILGRLVIVSYFVLAENSRGAVPIGVMGTLMLFYACLRTKTRIELGEKVAARCEEILDNVMETCSNYRLISDYHQRPLADRILTKAVYAFRDAKVPLNKVKMQTELFPTWLATILVFLFIAFESQAVLAGELSLGTFLATIKIYQEIGEQFTEGFSCVMELLGSKGALVKITTYLNLETDLKSKKNINRARRKLTERARTKIIGTPPSSQSPDSPRRQASQLPDSPRRLKTDGTRSPITPPKLPLFATDKVNISLTDVAFRYATQEKPVFTNASVEISQGLMVAIIGPRLHGKATLVHLLANIEYPDQGLVFVPSHLRVLHVTLEPMVIESLGLWQNLTFGLDRHHRDVTVIKRLLVKLGAKHLAELLDQELAIRRHAIMTTGRSATLQLAGNDGEEEDCFNESFASDWLSKLTTTDLSILNLARAFAANPEVLVMERPTMYFEESLKKNVYQVMTEYVKHRGAALDPSTADRRRPRTLIYSATSREEAQMAQTILVVKNGSVMQTDDKNSISTYFSTPVAPQRKVVEDPGRAWQQQRSPEDPGRAMQRSRGVVDSGRRVLGNSTPQAPLPPFK